MRSYRKSFAGVRAGRRSFEDACLINLEEDIRWNFYDYLSRNYCYCKLCLDNSNSEGYF